MDELLFTETGSIKAGTLEHIVDYLIEDCKDPTLVETFLVAGTHICNAEEIWRIVERRYVFYVKKKDSAQGREKVLRFLWTWIERDLHRDFLRNRDGRKGSSVAPEDRNVLYNELLKFLDNLSRETSNKYKLHILRSAGLRRKRHEKKLKLRNNENKVDTSPGTRESPVMGSLALAASASSANGNSSPTRKPGLGLQLSANKTNSIRISPMNTPPASLTPSSSNSSLNSETMPAAPKVYELGKFDFHDLEAIDVAQQMTLIEFDMFIRIQDSEFHNLNWKKDDPETRKTLAPNILRMVDRFNAVSYWVATEIVMQHELRARVNVLKKWIQIAELLREYGNYNGVMEVIGGLNGYAVQRLQQSWEQIPQRHIAVLEELNVLMDSKQNYREYRNALRMARPPVLPYLGVYLRDVLFVEEGNPNYVGDKKDKVLNFEKIQLLGDILMQIKRQQEFGYAFETSDVLQKYLKKLSLLPEEVLYKHSTMCEPPVSQQNSAHNSLNSGAPSGANSGVSSVVGSNNNSNSSYDSFPKQELNPSPGNPNPVGNSF